MVKPATTKKDKEKGKNQFVCVIAFSMFYRGFDTLTSQVFPPSPHWYSALEPISSITAKESNPTLPSEQTIHALTTQAAQLLSTDTELYRSKNGAIGSASTSDAAFLSRILSSGTLSDRLSALTLMVQASPVHNQRAFESLKSMSMKKGGSGGAGASVGGGKGESLKSLRALVDWWVGGGVPDRKLRSVIHPYLDLEALLTRAGLDQILP
jgi:ribosome biogenesis protein MAK21